MDLKELKKGIKELKYISDDDEGAHSLEDSLRMAVLKEIVNKNPESYEMAKEVLKTSKIRFSRWCA